MMQGPYEVELKIRVTDGTRTAIVTYTMPAGQIPTRETIQVALDAALAEAQKIGGEWRLQTRHEFENDVISDRFRGVVPEFATKDTWDE